MRTTHRLGRTATCPPLPPPPPPCETPVATKHKLGGRTQSHGRKVNLTLHRNTEGVGFGLDAGLLSCWKKGRLHFSSEGSPPPFRTPLKKNATKVSSFQALGFDPLEAYMAAGFGAARLQEAVANSANEAPNPKPQTLQGSECPKLPPARGFGIWGSGFRAHSLRVSGSGSAWRPFN